MSAPARPVAWLVSVPLLAGGWLGAHALAYALVAPDAHARAHLLGETGHAYLAWTPVALAALLAVAVVGLARARPRRAAGSLRLALLPVLGFAAQEHLERLLGGTNAAGTALEPAFLAGLALQLPLALVALLLARGLLRVAASLAPTGEDRRTFRVRIRRSAAPAPVASLPRIPALALGYGERGPPPGNTG